MCIGSAGTGLGSPGYPKNTRISLGNYFELFEAPVKQLSV